MSDRIAPHVLVVDHDPRSLSASSERLAGAGYRVDGAEDGAAALTLAAELQPDAVIAELDAPGTDGVPLVERLHAQGLPVVAVMPSDDVALAVAAMRAGAEDCLGKPLDLDALAGIVERLLERRHAPARGQGAHLRGRDPEGILDLLGESSTMQKVYEVARRVAATRATVLLTGESGTGKGVLAHALHALSDRARAPFVHLHCAALPASLLESELFGYESGAFTDADARHVGRLERAHGGTLFLDEVGEIPLLTQAKLLRVLQERTFERLGSSLPIEVDVRVIAATNRDLGAEVAAGRFREDLYYRLHVVHIELPPLRMRGHDIITLAEHFLRERAIENHKAIEGLTERARAKLLAHRWPGNVRELENTIERAIVLSDGPVLDEEDLPLEGTGNQGGQLRLVGSKMADIERQAIIKTLEACEGSTTRAAEILGISVRTIQYRLHDYGIARSNKRRADRVPRAEPDAVYRTAS